MKYLLSLLIFISPLAVAQAQAPLAGKTAREVEAVADITVQNLGPATLTQERLYNFGQYEAQYVDQQIPKAAFSDSNALQNWLTGVNQSLGTSDYEIYGRTTVVESILAVASKSGLSDPDLANLIANSVANYTHDEKERLALFATLSDRFYTTYNILRDPGQNTGEATTQNTSLNQLIQAAISWNSVQGGVCNDIVQALVAVGKKLFPDQDVFGFSNGTHFGVMVHRAGQAPTIINWGIQTDQRSELTFAPEVQTTLTRIFELTSEGTLKQIANMDTEVGAALKKLYTETSPTLRTGMDPSLTYVKFGDQPIQSHPDYSLNEKIGVVKTTDSVFLVFMGEVTQQKDLHAGTTALSASFQAQSGAANGIFTLHKTYQHRLLRYSKPKFIVELSAGGMADVSVTARLNNKTDPQYQDVGLRSEVVELNQKLSFQTKPSHEQMPLIAASVGVYEDFGRGNEGRQTGLESMSVVKGTLQALAYTHLFVNQIYAKGALHVPLNPNVQTWIGGSYQGSPIGQAIEGNTGIEAKATGRLSRVYLLVGASKTDISGYKTKFSLINDPTGGKVVAGVTLKNGLQGSVKVDGIGGVTRGNFIVRLPLKKKRRA